MAVAETVVYVPRKGICNNIAVCRNQISLLRVLFNDFRKHDTARRWDHYLHATYVGHTWDANEFHHFKYFPMQCIV